MSWKRIRPPTRTLMVLLFTVFAGSPLTGQSPDFDPGDEGRALTRAFLAGELTVVVEAFDARMREAMGGTEGVRAFHRQVREQLGDEAAVLDESVADEGDFRVYRRTVRFERTDEPMVVLWAFDRGGQVAGFSIQPRGSGPEEAPSRYLEYETRTDLRLPFTGEWVVFWGGRTVRENYHAAHPDQRFAYDLVVEVDGARHRGAGTANEDYYCWNRPIVAPGAGRVTTVRDDLPDNTPGRMDPSVPPGNHVVIDHGNDEYSFLAHLREGSVTVRVGDQVAAGDTVGLCGNSGNSSEPHLHYHLQDTERFGAGEGKPAQFRNYIADGEVVELGEPVQGQRIRPGGRDG